MPIDASIPLKGLLINRNDELLKQQRLAQGNMQMQQQREEGDSRKRLADLLPQAARGDQNATDQIAGIDPSLFLKLSAEQKAAAAQKTEDLTAAVRWTMADPNQRAQRWEQVIDHYGQEGLDLTKYRGRPDLAEQALLELGQLGKYLKPNGGEPTSMQRNFEFLKHQNPDLADQYLRNQAEGSPIVQRNEDGTMTVYPRSVLGGAQSGGPRPVQSKEEYDALPNGAEYIAPDGSRRRKGGQSASPAGGFPSSGY